MEQTGILFVSAVSIAFIHTLIGIDHYLPFVALSKANGWSMGKTMLTALLCGTGHVLSSVMLGFIGIGLSIGISSIVNIESMRGEIATYFLIVFGLLYMIYGIRRAAKNESHRHIAPDGSVIVHAHSKSYGTNEHDEYASKNQKSTIWWLFIFFILGPCEPLIPILMYPAVTQNVFTLILVTVSFMVCTLLTMLTMTFIGLKGINLIKINVMEKYSQSLAGFVILTSGVAVLLFPL